VATRLNITHCGGPASGCVWHRCHLSRLAAVRLQFSSFDHYFGTKHDSGFQASLALPRAFLRAGISRSVGGVLKQVYVCVHCEEFAVCLLLVPLTHCSSHPLSCYPPSGMDIISRGISRSGTPAAILTFTDAITVSIASGKGLLACCLLPRPSRLPPILFPPLPFSWILVLCPAKSTGRSPGPASSQPSWNAGDACPHRAPMPLNQQAPQRLLLAIGECAGSRLALARCYQPGHKHVCWYVITVC
jgi:hypothetical protein